MKKRILILGMVLALVAAMAMPMVALAGSTGTTEVSGQIAWEYTITPPAAITLGTFNTAKDYEATGKSISVSTTDPTITMCGIKVKDTKGTDVGFLMNGAIKLTNPLQVMGGALTYSPLTEERTLRIDSTPILDAGMSNFGVKQTIASGDLTKAAGSYSLTLTFTATFSAP